MSDSDSLDAVLAALTSPIKRYAWKHSVNPEDVAQEGRIGVLLAYRRWDSERGVPASAFCWQRAKGAMLDHVRTAMRPHRGGGQTPLCLDESSWVEAVAPGDPYAAVDAMMTLDWIRTLCSPAQLEVMDMYCKDMTITEIAAVRGTSPSASVKALKEVRKRVEREISRPRRQGPDPLPTRFPEPRRTVRAKDQPWWGLKSGFTLAEEDLLLLQALADGESMQEYASRTFYSREAIKSQMQLVKRKLGAPDAGQVCLVVAAMRLGLID